MKSKKIAVVLCGSGYKDGSEIRESVLTLLALSEQKAMAQCFAPDAPQIEVVNTLTGKVVENESRNMLVEAARIARSDIFPLSKLNANEFDGIIFPGGFGAAKNLCEFADKGSLGSVREDVKKVLDDFYVQKKPIGAICIAPALVALAFKDKKLTMTTGQVGGASEEIEKLGHKHVIASASECIVDKPNKIVTTPAYMFDDAPLAEIYRGISALVEEVIALS